MATLTALALGHRTRALQLGAACAAIVAVALASIAVDQRRTNVLVARYERQIISAVYDYQTDHGRFRMAGVLTG